MSVTALLGLPSLCEAANGFVHCTDETGVIQVSGTSRLHTGHQTDLQQLQGVQFSS